MGEALERAGADGPLALSSSGPPADRSNTHYGMILQSWPGGERRFVAHADFHGARIDWLG